MSSNKACVFSMRNHRIWRYAQKRKRFSTSKLTQLLGVQLAGLRPYLNALRAAGYFEVEGAGNMAGEYTWRLVRNTGPAAPMLWKGRTELYDPNGSGFVAFSQQRLWNALRISGCLSYYDAMARAEVSQTLCLTYFAALKRTGLAQRCQEAYDAPVFWQLVNDIGPYCPVLIKGRLFDQVRDTFLEETR
nr:hypothetical protein [Petrachloros mirabilis]